MPYCPHCSFFMMPLGSYLQPWNLVECPQCGRRFPAGSWRMEDGSPIGDPFEKEEDYEILRIVEVQSDGDPAREYHLSPNYSLQGAPQVAFISHNKADNSFARQLGTFLCHNGVEVWFDEWDLLGGDPIIDAIEAGLNRSTVFILVISPASLQSNWVREEIRAALMNKIQRGAIRIIPLLKERVDQLPPFIEGLKYIEFTKQGVGRESPWDDLLRAVYRRSERPPVLNPPRFVPRDDSNKNE